MIGFPPSHVLAGLLLALLACLAAPAARAEEPIPPSCRASCGATLPTLAGHSQPVQACMVRCRAALQFNASQAARPGAMRGRQLVAAPPPRSLPPPPAPRPALGGIVPVAHAAMPVPAATAPAAPAGPPRFGAIYAATPPNPAFGVSFQQRDRLMAHVQADTQCQTRGRAGCRLVVEFGSQCAAAAQATRNVAIMQTDDPSTHQVTFIAPGTGATRLEAEQAALAACSERDRTARCRIAASGCGNG